MQNTDYDVIIVGAGLSGIGAAYHLQTKCPHLRVKIIEARASVGGTWDLFKYPGIRSDSDMYTFGFAFNPWKSEKSISDGAAILAYMRSTIEKYDLDKKIALNTKLINAAWNTENAAWTLQTTQTKTQKNEEMTCRFLFCCTGYYDYENAYKPQFPNEIAFKGTIIHPQYWDEALDYTDKRVVIIGSGATAITMLPEMAKKARKVTMLQRSPTYIANLPSKDKIAEFLKKRLPENAAHQLIRTKNILFSIAFYNVCRAFPHQMRNFMLNYIKKYMGDKYDERHFTPKYNPWDQRLCVVPDNDFFKTLKTDRANIVTDTIKTFTETGVLTNNNQHLDADIIVTATGLVLKLFGGATMTIDGKAINPSQTHLYRGTMLSGVPNFAAAIGYTNASWTLKVDLLSHFVTRLLNYMHKNNYTICTPVFDNAQFETERLFDFDAGYILRSKDILPSQGSKKPWRVYENYIKDFFLIKKADLKDGFLRYW